MSAVKILLADDDAALRKIVKEQLTGMGYVVEEADDGQTAIEKLEKDSYALMLLDINMPNKSGIDVLRFLKEKKLTCKVIMLTGRVGFSIATESMKLGADEYVTKPFSLEYLVSTMQRVLSR
jgi:DNA-binding response OmpR family regulator